jgi:dihydropteroate synthase
MPRPIDTLLPGSAGRLVVMGVLNVTPDSFSDGGRYADLDAAVNHARQMIEAGADLIDVGGESTRPGARRVPAEEEARRVLPVVEALSREGIVVSVDTYRAAVAELALRSGATVVNDVSGGLGDPDMCHVVRDAGCPWILMHWRGHSATMAELAHYDDVVVDVCNELRRRVEDAVQGGVAEHQLLIDPGLGFAKDAGHNWALLAHLDAVLDIGPPVLVGASRKAFLGSVLADQHGRPRPTAEREDATAAITTYAALNGAWGVRVHDVRPSVDAAKVVAAIGAAR